MGLKVYPHHRPTPPPPPSGQELSTNLLKLLLMLPCSAVIKVLNLTPDGLKYNVGWAPCKMSYPKRKQGD